MRFRTALQLVSKLRRWIPWMTLGFVAGTLPGSPGFGQSLRTELSWASKLLRKRDAIGVQEVGLHVSHHWESIHWQSGTYWGELLQQVMPGYRLQTTLLLDRFEREGGFPENRDIYLCELDDELGTLLMPEGLFASEFSDRLPCSSGQLLTRVPLNGFVEQYVAPKPNTSFPVDIQMVGYRSLVQIPSSQAQSASSLLRSLSLSALELPTERMSYLWIQRLGLRSSASGNAVFVLPTLLTARSHAAYYDAFLNLPLVDGDQISLLDANSLQARLQSRVAPQSSVKKISIPANRERHYPCSNSGSMLIRDRRNAPP